MCIRDSVGGRCHPHRCCSGHCQLLLPRRRSRSLSGFWSCLSSPLNCVTSESLSGVGGSIISSVASWVMGDAHTWLSATGALMAQTTAPHIVTTYVQQEYVRVASVSPFIALLALTANVLHGLWRNDGAGLVRHTATFLPLGIIATLVGPTLATMVLRLADYLRRLGRGYAIVISGGLPRMRVRVVPWFRDRRLRWRGQAPI